MNFSIEMLPRLNLMRFQFSRFGEKSLDELIDRLREKGFMLENEPVAQVSEED